MKPQVFNFFITGIIQGSRNDDTIHDQCYRKTIKDILSYAFPASHIYCPVENHPESIQYNDSFAQSVFLKHINQIKKSDCIVVYLPQASMGSAIEMWEAHHHGSYVISISPMKINWVVRLFSDKVLSDIKSFETFVQSGGLYDLLERGKNHAKK